MLFLSFLACGPSTPWVNDLMIDVDVNGDGLVDVVGRYFGTVGDIDGDGYSDLVSAGQHFFYLSVLRGGPRFRGEVSVMLPNAGAGWAGVQDNVVH